ncbi:polynucleotide 5'-hydroxyl-kinase NOL9 [Drosophila grimshawi]|uniref:Polynucleotide 5'-hydroxyl-kinase NOL9 n=1 Tax=Drosophila grimshawi TaxID=7222 RepID=B4J9Y0_DROGR|nr:polynucleotide 5'-hydroxyl-kinase NOL9 [Drosophila grimshawi]EDW02567.1 GH19820 [Drosophila grimshawi]
MKIKKSSVENGVKIKTKPMKDFNPNRNFVKVTKRKSKTFPINRFEKRFKLDTETGNSNNDYEITSDLKSDDKEYSENVSSEYLLKEHEYLIGEFKFFVDEKRVEKSLLFDIEDLPEAEIISIPLGNGTNPTSEIDPETEIPSESIDSEEPGGETQVAKDAEMPSKDSTETDAEDLPELSIFENSFKSNIVLAVLKQDVEFYGTVVVTLLCGRITINGYKARPMDPLNIYSPKGFNWVVISPLANKKPPKDNVNWQDLNENFSRAQLDNILGNYNAQCDAIVLLQRNTGAQNLLATFAKHMAENVFPLVNATNRPHYASEYLLNSLVQCADRRGGALQVPTVWTKLALQSGSRLMVTGGKGVGKSTLIRYLINRHLERFQKLLVIDLDIGQPELFVPQTVSCCVIDAPLLGPGFFLNKQPDMAFVVGHVNVVMCAEEYARSVRHLLGHCRGVKGYAKMPWLINTMGYNKGFGLELMALIVDCVQPTDVVQIASNRPINNFEEPLDSKSLARVVPIIYTADEFKRSDDFPKYALHQLRSALPPPNRSYDQPWLMSAKDVRYSNFLARLSQALRGNAKHLTDCQPLQIDLNKLQILCRPAEDWTREELIAGVEANLVYLCKSAASNQPVECFGIGVVRAIDYDAEKLYLLPAMPLTRLLKVNCLALGGDLSLPQGFFKHQGAGVANNVPYVFIIDDSKSSKSIQHFYHRPPEFLGQPVIK